MSKPEELFRNSYKHYHRCLYQVLLETLLLNLLMLEFSSPCLVLCTEMFILAILRQTLSEMDFLSMQLDTKKVSLLPLIKCSTTKNNNLPRPRSLIPPQTPLQLLYM